MQRFFSILADAVTEFEGTVDKFTGDGIMAVFGAPIAHEDHARRACYAALQMLDDVSDYAAELRRGPGLNFSTRIGINSGEVVAGAIGEGGGGDYTAIGHTVGLAQRMEALAEPGKAYLTEHTAALATGFLELEDLGEFEIKGASRPVRVFELAGVGQARSRLDLSRERGFSSFVGRGPRRWRRWRRPSPRQARAGAARRPGRRTRRRQEPALPRVRPALPRARPRGLRGAGPGARDHDPVHAGAADAARLLRDRRARARATGAGEDRRALAAARPDFAEDLPLMFDFLGVPDPDRPLAAAERRGAQRALGRVVCRLVNAPSRRKTLVLIVEDLHWVDEGSNVLLGDLVASIEGTNTLALVNFRPEFSPPWRAARPTGKSPWSRWPAPTPASCCATWPARTPPWTGSTSRSTSAPRAIPSSSRRSSASWPRPGARGRAWRLPPGAADRGREGAGHRAGDPRRPHRPPRPRPPSSCCRSPRWSARRSASGRWG